jgi:hypothetical protein
MLSQPPLDDVTRFYAIGDVPYTQREATELITQIDELEDDAEFLIHVGDIRTARNKTQCTIQEYYEVADILNKSHAPVFIILGGKSSCRDRRQRKTIFIPDVPISIETIFLPLDNEWNDCANVDEGFEQWMTVFGKFEEQWDHSFEVTRHEERPENFSFLSKRTLFFGLNIVGGENHNPVQVRASAKALDGSPRLSLYTIQHTLSLSYPVGRSTNCIV